MRFFKKNIQKKNKIQKFYFKTYEDQNIKMVNLKSLDLNAKEIKTFSLNGPQPVNDMTYTVK